MKQKVKRLIKHPLIYGSSVVVLGTLGANFINFLFNLYIIRSISTADYGVYASVISIISFPALIASATVPLVVQFAGTYFAKGKLDMVRGFYVTVMKFFLLVGAGIFILFLLFIPQISVFLHIKNDLILVLTDLIIFASIIGIINTAFIQAKLAFGFQVFVTFIMAITKLALGIIIVMMGYSVTGVVFATLLASLIAYIVSFIPIHFVFDRKITAPKIKTKELFTYGIPSTMTLIGLTSLISADILLIKHFFDPVNAGIYASLSLVGRIIFYISSPITFVMFPILVQKHSMNQKLTNTLLLSLCLVMAPSLLFTALYFIFPDQVLLLFTKKHENLVVSPLLGFFGIFISLYCMLNILASFYLSIKKTAIYVPVLIAAAMQIVLINLYHQSFLQIIWISTGTTFLLVCALLFYFPFAVKK